MAFEWLFEGKMRHGWAKPALNGTNFFNLCCGFLRIGHAVRLGFAFAQPACPLCRTVLSRNHPNRADFGVAVRYVFQYIRLDRHPHRRILGLRLGIFLWGVAEMGDLVRGALESIENTRSNRVLRPA